MTATVDPDSVGGRLRAARKRAELSQGQLGAEVGVSQSVVSNWEQGKYRVQVDELLKLANALGIHPAELLPGAAAAFLVIYDGGIGWSGTDRDRAEEFARNTESVVCSTPIIADYRKPREDPNR